MISKPILWHAPENARSTIPRYLYRRFSERAHAENFIANGEVRFRSLLRYRELEGYDVRHDRTEGTIESNLAGATISFKPADGNEYSEPMQLASGTMRKHLTYPEMYFISCYSYRQHPDQMKYGPWVVKIRARPWFTFIKRNCDQYRFIFWGRVKYFDLNNPNSFKNDQLWLSKSGSLKSDYEFRILLILQGLSRESAVSAPVRMSMGDISQFAEIVD